MKEDYRNNGTCVMEAITLLFVKVSSGPFQSEKKKKTIEHYGNGRESLLSLNL